MAPDDHSNKLTGVRLTPGEKEAIQELLKLNPLLDQSKIIRLALKFLAVSSGIAWPAMEKLDGVPLPFANPNPPKSAPPAPKTKRGDRA